MFINGIEFLTVRDMAERLHIKPSAVKVRLHVAGETPISKDALYSIKSFDAIKNSLGKGRPRKTAMPGKAVKGKKPK